ncbi:MAG: SixA phosphatase family protein [Pseudomonadota bacterium]
MASKLRELMLLRHAKSDWKQSNLMDINRPLSDKGKKSALKMGKWLRSQNLMPDLILASPAKRAQQTLRRICSECPANKVTVDELYLADLSTLQKILAEAPEAMRVMIIGHNPGLEYLYRFLHNEPEEDAIHLFPTASLAHFILPQDWHALEQGDGKLVRFIRPKDIPFK